MRLIGTIGDIIYLGETMHVMVAVPEVGDVTVAVRNEGQLHQAAALEAGRSRRRGLAAGGMPDPGGGLVAASRQRRVVSLAHPSRRPGPGPCSGPGCFWLLVFFLVPLLIMLAYSFMPRGIYGGVEPGFTLEHYARFFDPLYLARPAANLRCGRSACTVICLLLGYPVAYVIARSGRWRNLPALPGGAAVLDQLPGPHLRHDLPAAGHRADQRLAAASWDWIDEPLTMLYTPFAVMAGAGVRLSALHDPADLRLAGEARFLAAGGGRGARAPGPSARFRRVTLPLSMPGVVAGSPAGLHPGPGLVPHVRPAGRRQSR